MTTKNEATIEKVGWSETQGRRLRELAANQSILQQEFCSPKERDRKFQACEKEVVALQRKKLNQFLDRGGKSELVTLSETISNALISQGFVKVTTPTIISAESLEKMTIGVDHPLHRQIYWLNKNKCLRPMLAPNLYSLMQDFSRQKNRPVRFFEVGPCFRKETDGPLHAREFTMLNLVEMGTEPNQCRERLQELGTVILNCAGLSGDFHFQTEESEVYGTTQDIISGENSVELASGAIGPHPLDAEWGVHEHWVGLGLGVERLLMVAKNDSSISRWCKSLSYFNGIPLKI